MYLLFFDTLYNSALFFVLMLRCGPHFAFVILFCCISVYDKYYISIRKTLSFCMAFGLDTVAHLGGGPLSDGPPFGGEKKIILY